MTLPEASIRRHVLAVMISAVILLFGVLALRGVGVDRVPNIDLPVITVTVSLTGADPTVIDAAVTEVVERRVNRVPGIDSVRSVSTPGQSVVTATFELDKDVDVAFNEVQSRVNEVLGDLPADADPPEIAKTSIESQPIMWLALQGDRNVQDLSLYALETLRPQLENIPGVGEVQFGGGQGRNIRIEIDPDRLAALGVTVTDLIDAIGREHVQMSGGFLVAGDREELIQLDLEYHDVSALADLVVSESGGSLVRIGDVAEIVDGLADRRRAARFDGREATSLGIVKVPGTNTVAIIEEVKERLRTEIQPQLPPGLSLSLAYDESLFILDQIDALYLTLALGVVLAALVIWIFLKSLRSTAIVSMSIPVSLMAAVAVIYFFGYTLNSVTMLGLLLLIGIVVDDAIVVLENVYRHRRDYGGDRYAAAISGSNEVFFAVIASSAALIAIFASVIFLDAIVGRFFRSFAVVVTFGVLASSVVALTLVPMLASRFLTTGEEGRVARAMERGLAVMDRGYTRLLAFALRARWLVLLAVAGLLGAIAFIATDLDAEFAPQQDTGQFVVSLATPLGSSLAYTESRLDLVEQTLAGVPEIRSYFTSVGAGGQSVNRASIFVTLVERGERDGSQRQIMDRLQAALADVPGGRASVSSAGIAGGGQRGEPLQFVVTGPDLTALGEVSGELLDRLEAGELLDTVDLDLDLELPQLAFRVDRARATSLGISAEDAARTANVLIRGTNVARYDDVPGDKRRYNIRLKARDGTFDSPADLRRIYIRSADGAMVRMDTIASFEEVVGPAAISHHDLRYAAEFYATPSGSLDEAVAEVDEVAADMLPFGYQLEYVGDAQEMERTGSAIQFVLILAVTLVYMVLASQFNSFLQPVYIMVAQPLALIGGLLGLWLGGYSLNIFSMIGLVLLMGLVTKNGILLVDLTNQYREKRGLGIDEALMEACPIRLRPILMTSLTLILAMLPALFGVGAGAETNAPMAAAIIGGMIVSMLLTLIVIPAAYSLMEAFLARRGMDRGSRRSGSGEEAPAPAE